MIKRISGNLVGRGMQRAAIGIALAAGLAFAAPASFAASGDLHYVLLSAGKEGNSSTVNGTSDDWQAAQRHRSGDQALLFFRQDGVGYLIRDPALLQRAERIAEPQRRLGAQQGELGRRQGELGRQQGELGARQGRIGAQMANARPGEQAELGRRMADLGTEQAALGKQQTALGAEQAKLGKEQRRLAGIAQDEMKKLIADARARNLVERAR